MELDAQKIKAALFKVFNRIWGYMKIAKIELIVLFGSLILDLLTKFIIARTMNLYETVVIIPSFLEFYYTVNTKAAFGSAFGLENLLGDAALRVFFLIMTTVSLVLFAYLLYYFRKKHIFSRAGLALIIAGALGNFYDRLFLHGVRDFVQIVFFGLDIPLLGGTSFAIFNIADVSLVTGVIMFAVFFIFIFKMPSNELVGPVYRPDYNAQTDGTDEEADNDDGMDLMPDGNIEENEIENGGKTDISVQTRADENTEGER